MNLDPAPPVRPLLTHVIADEPLRREAGIKGCRDSAVDAEAVKRSFGSLENRSRFHGVAKAANNKRGAFYQESC